MKVLHRQILMGVFFLFALVLSGFVGWRGLSSTVQGLETVYLDRVVPLRDLKQIADLYAVNIVDTTHKARNGNHSTEQALKDVEAAEVAIARIWQGYLQTFLVDEEKALVREIEPLMQQGNASITRLKSILRAQDGEALAAYATHDLYPAIDPLSEKFSALIEVQLTVARAEYQRGSETYTFSRMLLIAIVLISAIIGTLIALRVTRRLLNELGGEPAEVCDAVARIAAGDLEHKMAVKAGDTQSIVFSLAQMQTALKQLVDEIGNMVEAAGKRGDFSVRMSVQDKQGFMQTLAERLNQLSQITETGLTDITRVAHALAGGDLTQKIDKTYPGQFGQTATAVNATVNALNQTINDVRSLVDTAASRGDFSQRMSLDNRQGYARTLAELLNQLNTMTDNGLAEIRRIAKTLAQGDLTQRIEQHSPGVFGETTQAMNSTVDNLQQLVGNIQLAVEHINRAAQEIAAGNQDLSSRTEEQASNLEETAASMEQITGTVKQNAESAHHARELSGEAQLTAGRGGEVVGRMARTMDDIQQSSRRIADIIGVIDGIAFQTNILALNAAVEAARAGEQGRGFAVVATEVRTLAQRSAAAAKDIKGLIADSVSKVEDGNHQVTQTGAAMDEIIASIQRVGRMIEEIESASAEQSNGIEQVNLAVSHMDEVTQQNAALVEEATAAAESLKEQATQLSQVVASFRLNRDKIPTTVIAAPTSTRRKKLPPPSLASDSLDDEWHEF